MLAFLAILTGRELRVFVSSNFDELLLNLATSVIF
uniref:Uncharacterized protein n=1 Tax=Rhizophora mucronata TaxID=61149 RepID=A0A2P2MZA1_RHIMU